MTAATVYRGALHSRLYDTAGEDWRDRALCAGADPELFFPATETGPATTAQIRQAKQICARCPVTTQCRDYARSEGIAYGVWGGESARDRRRPNQPRTCDHCGTRWSPLRRKADRPQRYCSRRCYWDARARRAGCGTNGGEARHRRAGEPVCDACRLARQLHQAQQRAAHGVIERRPQWTDEEIATVARLAAAGRDNTQIAAALGGRTPTAVRLIRSRHLRKETPA